MSNIIDTNLKTKLDTCRLIAARGHLGLRRRKEPNQCFASRRGDLRRFFYAFGTTETERAGCCDGSWTAISPTSSWPAGRFKLSSNGLSMPPPSVRRRARRRGARAPVPCGVSDCRAAAPAVALRGWVCGSACRRSGRPFGLGFRLVVRHGSRSSGRNRLLASRFGVTRSSTGVRSHATALSCYRRHHARRKPAPRFTDAVAMAGSARLALTPGPHRRQ